jgi:hypothetical protein
MAVSPTETVLCRWFLTSFDGRLTAVGWGSDVSVTGAEAAADWPARRNTEGGGPSLILSDTISICQTDSKKTQFPSFPGAVP